MGIIRETQQPIAPIPSIPSTWFSMTRSWRLWLLLIRVLSTQLRTPTTASAPFCGCNQMRDLPLGL